MKATTKDIIFQNYLSRQFLEKDFEFDVELTDDLIGIEAPIDIFGKIAGYESSSEGEKLVIDFDIKYEVLFLSDGVIRTFPFSRSLKFKTDLHHDENTVFFIDPKLASCSFRILNPRKLFIKTKICSIINSFTKRNQSVLCDTQNGCCVKSIPFVSSLISEKSLLPIEISDEVVLGDGYEPIFNIVRACAKVSSHECEVLDGYINIKGSLSIVFVYTSEFDQSRLIKVERQISFEKNSPCAEAEDGMIPICKFIVDSVSGTVGIDTYGERRSIDVSLVVLPRIYFIKNDYGSFVTDIFLPNHEEMISVENIKYTSLGDPIVKSFTCEGLADTGELVFDRIISSNASLLPIESESDELIRGVLKIDMIGQTPEGIKSCSIKKDFEQALPFPSALNVFEIVENSISIAGENNISYKTFFKITSVPYKCENVEAITSAEFFEAKFKKDQTIVYYPDDNEPIWYVAKKYHISPEEIKKNNPQVNGENVGSDEIIIIKR